MILKVTKCYHLVTKLLTVRAWLLGVDGVPVAFLQGKMLGEFFEVGLVEVRPDCFGNRLGLRIVFAVQEKMGVRAIGSGKYTAEGLKHLAPFFHSQKFIDLYDDDCVLPPQVFVKDWRRRLVFGDF